MCIRNCSKNPTGVTINFTTKHLTYVYIADTRELAIFVQNMWKPSLQDFCSRIYDYFPGIWSALRIMSDIPVYYLVVYISFLAVFMFKKCV